jgi:Tfp pilus assembly protein PilP
MIYFSLCFLLLTTVAVAQTDARKENLFQDKTKIENPFELRDPFKAPRVRSSGKNKYAIGKGQYTNIQEADIQKLNLNDFKVVGVLIGKERRALVHANAQSKEVIILKEGMKLGPDQTELKAILPGGLVLVEKILNVYGQEEFLETVIPISK